MNATSTNKPIISFVTISYNGYKDTCELIESLYKHITSVPYEIIVVDNASTHNDAKTLQEKYPTIHTIRSEHNGGFSAGNNIGIEQAKGEYIFLINNDTYIEEDNLLALIERVESKPEIGAVSPKIQFAFPPKHIQYAGYTKLSPITLRNQPIGFDQPDQPQYNIPQKQWYLHGAALLLKREIIEKVGPMPELFFLYYEELDWTTQMRYAGYELWYEPRMTVFHKESQSTGQASPLRTYYLTRNRLLYAYRNLKGVNRYLSIIYQIGIAVPKGYIINLFKRNIQVANAHFKGAVDFFKIENKNAQHYE